MRLPRPVRSRKATRIVDDFSEIIGLFGCLALARRAAQDLPLVRKPPEGGGHQRSGILLPTRGQSLLIFYKKRNR